MDQAVAVAQKNHVAGLGAPLRAILISAVKNRASDVHLKVGMPPLFRIDGVLRPLDLPSMEAQELDSYLAALCHDAGFSGLPRAKTEMDFAVHLEGVGRYRCHLFRERGRWAGLLRVVPETIPTFEDLRLPPVVKSLVELDRGIVLVTGATGMGKSTTVASILSAMSASRSLHILTIEDPIEFVIPSGTSAVSQRGIGVDVPDFDTALEASFREDPDVLFLGELRSSRGLEVALQAGESGHLCLSTIHTQDVLSTIGRIAAMVAEDRRRAVFGRIAESLKAVICQRLVPLTGRPGRILASEVLVSTPSLRDAIRDPVKHKGIPALLHRESSGSHCQSFDQHLLMLVRNNLVSIETARSAASNPAELLRSYRMG